MRPRRVGEVLDAAIKIYTRNARTLMGLAAVVVIPMQVVSGLVLNFIPDLPTALAEMRRVAPDGVVAAYVWDYSGGMEMPPSAVLRRWQCVNHSVSSRSG